MTKTLTEQWREGTLPEGWYYLKVKSELANYPVIAECVINHSSLKPYSDFYEYDDSHVEEVLAPVPSFDEYKELVRKSDKLDKIMSDTVTNQGDCRQIVEDNLNRQIEHIQKQLSIAKKALEDIRVRSQRDWDEYDCCVCAINAKTDIEEVK